MSRRSKRKDRHVTDGLILDKVRQVERASNTGATGFTLIKRSSTPVARLVDQKRIGPEELAAADDIATAFMAIAGALMVRSQAFERVDHGQGHAEPLKLITAQARYRTFAGHWSVLAKRGDRTLEVLVAAVVDERPFYLIEEDLGLRHGKAKQATIAGLRDYAARAHWVRGALAAQWLREACTTFPTVHPMLSRAVAAARVE